MFSNSIKKPNKIDYTLTFLFIVLCGFTSGGIIPGKTYIIIIFGLIYAYRHHKILQRTYQIPLLYLTAIIIVSITQYFFFKEYNSILTNTIMLVVSGYFILLMEGEKFKITMLNIMTFLCIISLFFYAIMVVTNYVPNISFLNDHPKTYRGIFIFNMRIGEIANLRNCGPFWEPGAFAGYIILTFVLFFNKFKILWQRHRYKVIILILTLISTFSSQGYIIGAILFFFALIQHSNRRNLGSISIVICLIALLAYEVYNSLPFLKAKVDNQITLTKTWDDNASLQSANRFTTTMLDLENIARQPILGCTSNLKKLYGQYDIVIYAIENSGAYGSGSGVTLFIAQNGIPLFLVWLLLSIRAAKLYFKSNKATLFFITILLILGQGEAYMGWIFYQIVPFLHLLNKRNLRKMSHNQYIPKSSIKKLKGISTLPN